MSLLYTSFTNNTPFLNTEDSSHSYSKNPTLSTQLKDEIVNYNYERFINGQLTFAIISLVIFNYYLMKDQSD